MTHADDTTFKQENQAEEQRIAGRDYHETLIHQYADIKLYMLLLTEDKLDYASVANGRNFIYRFGKDFNPSIRQKIIALKQLKQLTEREVKNLLATGGMSVNKKTEEVQLSKDRYTFYFGWILIAFVIVQCALNLLLVALSSHSPMWRQTIAQLGIGGVCMASIWFANWLYIAPYRVLQRVSAESQPNSSKFDINT